MLDLPLQRAGMSGASGTARRASSLPAAAAATPRGLVWLSDDKPGIRRERVADGFAYRDLDGHLIRNAAEIRRIRALAIPPAYERVWISPRPNGHLQAIARDAGKFERMLEFGAALPRLRGRVKADLAAPIGAAPRRDSVLATLVRLLDTTLVRVGNDEYARTNRSFGLTTLRNRHVAVMGSRIRLKFRGKSGIEHEVDLEDPRVARVVRRCQAMPGQELFQYEDEAGAAHAVGSADVNDYIRAASGSDFSAKDFRTWHGSAHALALWAEQCGPDAACRRSANQLLAEVAKRLGNTVAVCRKSYVHPRVLETLASEVDTGMLARLDAKRRAGLSAAERRLLAFLGHG
jgi:DNA topoisomerase I